MAEISFKITASQKTSIIIGIIALVALGVISIEEARQYIFGLIGSPHEILKM